MIPGMDYAERLMLAMEHARATKSSLAKSLGLSYQAVAKIFDGRTRSLSAENSDKAARVLGVNASWLASGLGSMALQAETMPLMAHALSHPAFTVPTLTKGDLMEGEMPERFVYALEDDAMGAHGRQGTEVLFVKGAGAKIGAGVLVKDHTGALHVRRLAQGREPGHWLAVAPNDLYRTLDSLADGLEVLAVWRGVVNRGLEDA